MMLVRRLSVRRLRSEAQIPRYMTAGAAGMDLAACPEEPIMLRAGEWRSIPTGIAVAVSPGFELQIRPRSGLALRHGVTVLNAPGTVDADYRGEVMVLLVNLGSAPFVVRPGDRIAQAVLAPVVRAEVVEVEALNETERAGGGFGSTDERRTARWLPPLAETLRDAAEAVRRLPSAIEGDWAERLSVRWGELLRRMDDERTNE